MRAASCARCGHARRVTPRSNRVTVWGREAFSYQERVSSQLALAQDGGFEQLWRAFLSRFCASCPTVPGRARRPSLRGWDAQGEGERISWGSGEGCLFGGRSRSSSRPAFVSVFSGSSCVLISLCQAPGPPGPPEWISPRLFVISHQFLRAGGEVLGLQLDLAVSPSVLIWTDVCITCLIIQE